MAASTGGDDDIPQPVPPECPRALQLWFQCEKYHCLLVAGGVLDQPFVLWQMVQVAGAAFEQYQQVQAVAKQKLGGTPTQQGWPNES